MREDPAVVLAAPTVADGAAVHDLARATPLDRNSAYAYLIACRDFAASSVVAHAHGRLVGFVIAYRRPPEPDTVFVWQVAVAGDQRGRGLARRMLEHVLARTAARHLEATVTPSNAASASLFRAVARERAVACVELPLFAARDFPVGSDHEAEVLFRIGPLPPGAPGTSGAG